MNNLGIKFDLPEHLGDKAARFGEYSYGAVRVILVLMNGDQIKHVLAAGGRNVIRASDPVSEARLCNLNPSDIIDVLPDPE